MIGKTYNPWYYNSSDVEIFHEATATTTRVARAPTGISTAGRWRRFADAVLDGAPIAGAAVEDGVASVRGMVAIARSAETGRPVRLADVAGAV